MAKKSKQLLEQEHIGDVKTIKWMGLLAVFLIFIVVDGIYLLPASIWKLLFAEAIVVSLCTIVWGWVVINKKMELKDLHILLIGKNCGRVKLQTQIETGNIILNEDLFERAIKDTMLYGRTIYRHFAGKCPSCSSSNTIKNPHNGKTFWGCLSCSYGMWEQHLPDKQVIGFCSTNGLTYAPQRYTKMKTKKKKIVSTPDAVQGSLF